MSEGPSLFDSENSACEFIPHLEIGKDPSFLSKFRKKGKKELFSCKSNFHSPLSR